eukprot:TRINITY_DN72557_c0_g1_i1.p1 TRINITY_DN72557_c0_g1~~TRINITY_DN72557_c0_g1_i1.p1  ORF type:complete len:314 (+),score=54.86 TRINITY_DN72557_c0_g1_i1:71-1012(+)
MPALVACSRPRPGCMTQVHPDGQPCCAGSTSAKPKHSEEEKTSLRARALKAAAGVKLRAQVSGGEKKTLRNVLVDEESFVRVHEEACTDMVEAFEQAGEETWEDAAEEVGMPLEMAARAPTKEEVVGNYVVSGGRSWCHKGAGSKYPMKSFEIFPENIIMYDEMPKHYEQQGKTQPAPHTLGEGEVFMIIKLMKRNVRFKNTLLGWLSWMLASEVVYTFTISENGILRFHLSPGLWTLTKLFAAFCDSERWWYLPSNIKHAAKHGCYCLGIFWMTKASKRNGPARPVLMRYNRWAEDLGPYWAAVNQSKDEAV